MSGPAANDRSPLAGIAMVVMASLTFSLIDSGAKHAVSAGVPLVMAVWARYLFQALATSAFVLPMAGWGVLRTHQPLFHLARGLVLIGNSLMVFLSLKYMPVGELTAIVMVTPLVVTLLAGTLFKEHVSPMRWALVAGGFLGTLVIIRPGGHAFGAATLLPLSVVAFNCVFQLMTRRLARSDNPLTVTFYTGWIGAVALAPLLPLSWIALDSPSLWGVLAATGIVAALGHFFLIMGYQRTPATTLTPYLYTQIGFAMLAGWLLFDHVPDGWSFAGMGLIALCGVAGAWLTLVEQRRA